MSTYALLMAAPVIALLAWAAVEDLRARRIPNWLTFSLVLAGITQSFTPYALVTPGMSILGFLLGFSLPFVLFVLNAVGGGDVKLLAGLGAWFGPVAILQIFVIEKVIGLVIVLAQATAQGRMRTLFRNSAVVAVTLAHVREVGLDHVRATGLSARSVDRPLPYAVPVLLAVAVLLTAG